MYYCTTLSPQHQITPLHVASKWGKGNMVSLLIDKGANYEAKTRDGLTPLHCAARSGHEAVVDMLLEKGAPITSKTKVCSLPDVAGQALFILIHFLIVVVTFKLLKPLGKH